MSRDGWACCPRNFFAPHGRAGKLSTGRHRATGFGAGRMSESAQIPPANHVPATSKSGPGNRPGRRPAIVAAVGGLLTLAAIGLILQKADFGHGVGRSGTADDFICRSRRHRRRGDHLDAVGCGALVEDAQRCRIPLVSMTLSRGTAAIGSTIRIRSGSYVSPYFTVTEEMQRFAVPLPCALWLRRRELYRRRQCLRRHSRSHADQGTDRTSRRAKHPVIWRAVSPC